MVENGIGSTTCYQYDVLDNLAEVRQNAQPSGSTCTGGQLRTFDYDSLSRLIEANNPESGTITYSYDDNGNLDLRTDARGIATNHDYDALNRITLKSYIDTAAPNPTPWVDYTYGTTAPNVGRLARVHSDGMSSDYTYDTLGRVVSSTQTTNQTAYAFTYEYNLDDTLDTITYPSSDEVTYGYDAAGRPSTVNGVIQGQPKSYLTAASYAPHGAAAQMTLGNGRIERSCFNSRLQPVQIALGTTLSGPSDCAIQGPDLLHLEFSYGTSNNNGNVLSQKVARPGFFDEQHYRYDGVNRLGIVTEGVAPSGPDGCPGGEKWCRDYGYDAFGNRAIVGNSGPTLPQATPTSLGAFSTATNRLTAAGYDNAGNLTGHTGLAQEILYDAENRMVEFSGPAGLQREGGYAYDGEGRRVQAVSTIGGTSTTTTYVYDAFGNLAAEYATQAPSNPGTYYRTTDHLGSTRLITKADGTIDGNGGCLDFYPSGEQIESGTGNRGLVPCYGGVGELAQKFTGKERDDESGLDYFVARFYASSLGRFTTTDGPFVDQIGDDPQSWSLYSYVRNNPLQFVDPDGRIGAVYDPWRGDLNCQEQRRRQAEHDRHEHERRIREVEEERRRGLVRFLFAKASQQLFDPLSGFDRFWDRQAPISCYNMPARSGVGGRKFPLNPRTRVAFLVSGTEPRTSVSLLRRDVQVSRHSMLWTEYAVSGIIVYMAWEVEFTDEFGRWWETLSENQQDDVAYSVGLLAELGPALGIPHSSRVNGSRYTQRRELRTQSAGRPLRTLYAFNPARTAILLIGGDKTGDDRWYETFVPVADRLYEEHLDDLRKENKL